MTDKPCPIPVTQDDTHDARLELLAQRCNELAPELAVLCDEANELVKEAVLYRLREASLDCMVFASRVRRGTLTRKDGGK